MKQNFRKNRIVTGKTQFVVIDSFCTPHSLASGRAVLYGNGAVSILLLLTKKRYSNFFKRVYTFFRKFVSKLKH